MLISHLFLLVVFVLRTGVAAEEQLPSGNYRLLCKNHYCSSQTWYVFCKRYWLWYSKLLPTKSSVRVLSFCYHYFRFLPRDPKCDISAYCVLNFELLLLHNSYWIVKKSTFIYVPLDCRELCLRNEHDLRECSVMVNLVLYFFYEIVLINPKGLRNFKRFA